MFQTRPKIHRYRSDLDFHFCIDYAVGKKDRNGYKHMITFITAFFWIFNIIFDRKNFQIALIADHLRQTVNIRCKGTNKTYPRNVIDIAYHVLDRRLMAIPP